MSWLFTQDAIPRQDGRPAPLPGGTADDAGTPVGPARNRILIVEDNYFVALTVENALADAGYEILGVIDSGEEALERAREQTPHLVVMDIRLAGEMDGIDAAIALRALGITCLMASAHSDDAMKARGSAALPAGWLVKPFSDSDLVAAVHAALRRKLT